MAETMEQAVRSGLAFNPLSAADGQGEVFVGANQNRLVAAMAEHGWSDLRFLTKRQIDMAGWSLAGDALPVQVTFRNEQQQWDNKVLFNAAQINGIPPLDAMLAVAQTRLSSEMGKSTQFPEILPEMKVSAGLDRNEELPGNPLFGKRVIDEDESVVAADLNEEAELLVGPARRVVEQEEVIAITPVFREKGIGDEGPAHVGEQMFDHAAATMLGKVFKERVPGSGEYVREGEKRVAFLDKGGSLTVRDQKADCYQAVMELAKSKGWEAIELTGKPEHVARGWLEAQLMGIEVVGFKPTEKDLAALDKRRAELAKVAEVVPVIAEKVPEGATLATSGQYVGPVVDIKDGYVIQSAGVGLFMAHKLSDFVVPPRMGDPLDVQYKNGRAVVREPKVQSRDVGGGREIGGR